ncbi:MAG: hypothetical protein JSU08_09515 [Acidobacteria bacterium]|nr:hypothetical protein [Acidobacteriota bacterium]
MLALVTWGSRAGLDARTTAAVASVHVLLLLLFVLAWHDGVPLWPTSSLIEQQARVQTAFLLWALPWLAVRSMPRVSHSELALSAALLARRPGTLVLAHLLGSALVVVAVVVAAVPVVVLAGQMSVAAFDGVAVRALDTGAVCAMAAASAAVWSLVTTDRVWAWVGAQGTTCVICVPALWWGGPWLGGAIGITGALVTTAVAMSTADRTCRYVAD